MGQPQVLEQLNTLAGWRYSRWCAKISIIGKTAARPSLMTNAAVDPGEHENSHGRWQGAGIEQRSTSLTLAVAALRPVTMDPWEDARRPQLKPAVFAAGNFQLGEVFAGDFSLDQDGPRRDSSTQALAAQRRHEAHGRFPGSAPRSSDPRSVIGATQHDIVRAHIGHGRPIPHSCARPAGPCCRPARRRPRLRNRICSLRRESRRRTAFFGFS